MNASFPFARVLHLTDTHLHEAPEGISGGINTLSSLEEVIALARRDHWPADAVVVTGDLANDSGEGAYQLLRCTLREVSAPVYCLAGNHDDPALMQRILAGANIHLLQHALLGPWLLVFLNTYVPGQTGGHLDKAELQSLETILQRHAHSPALVFLHHPPVPIGSPWLDALGLDNPEDLFAVIDRSDEVKGILWGHAHQAFSSVRRGVQLLGTPSTCMQFKPGAEFYTLDSQKPGYRWLVLKPDGTFDTGIHRLP